MVRILGMMECYIIYFNWYVLTRANINILVMMETQPLNHGENSALVLFCSGQRGLSSDPLDHYVL